MDTGPRPDAGRSSVRAGFSVDPWLRSRYDFDNYHCLHFTRDVWLDMTGEDISERLAVLRGGKRHKIYARDLRAFARLAKPTDPCIAFLRRPNTLPHIGVYLRGRILHLRNTGAAFQIPCVAAQEFREVRYYR